MNIKEGTEVAAIVDGGWHSALCEALALSQRDDEPFHLMFGKASEWSENIGLWLTPDTTYTSVGIIQLFVPWTAIRALAIVAEGQTKRLGFQP